MKIVFVTASISRKAGGLFESVRRLAQGLSKYDSLHMAALGLRDDFSELDTREWEPVPVEACAVVGPRVFGYSPSMRDRLRDSELDLAHTHGLWMYPSAAVLGWQSATGRPHVISPRGMLDEWALNHSRYRKYAASWAFERAHLAKAGCIHALCDVERASIRRFGLKNPICVIPNGVDVPDGRDCDIADRGSWERKAGQGASDGNIVSPRDGVSVIRSLRAEGRKVLLYLGRIHPKKGLLNLLRAWSEIHHEWKSESANWVLAIAGWDQGGHGSELRRLAHELQLDYGDGLTLPNVTPTASLFFLGPQFGADKAACYRSADAFVLPSFSEGLPMAILEAWAHAKPVLMTAECNLPEGFEREAAIRIEPNPRSITCGLKELFRSSESTRRSMGQGGQALVVERFAWPKIASEMKQVYEWLLGGGARPRCVTV
jgi:poly(glycerol-phosphate) alpha-glucosyltransferase